MSTQEQEREAAATARVHGLDAEVAKLRAQIERAERQRNEYANRVLEAEERHVNDCEEALLREEALARLQSLEAAALEMIGASDAPKWRERADAIRRDRENANNF